MANKKKEKNDSNEITEKSKITKKKQKGKYRALTILFNGVLSNSDKKSKYGSHEKIIIFRVQVICQQ